MKCTFLMENEQTGAAMPVHVELTSPEETEEQMEKLEKQYPGFKVVGVSNPGSSTVVARWQLNCLINGEPQKAVM